MPIGVAFGRRQSEFGESVALRGSKPADLGRAALAEPQIAVGPFDAI